MAKLPSSLRPASLTPRALATVFSPLGQVQAWATSPEGSTLLSQARMALKMAIAAAVSLILAQGLNWEYPFYAVIAAIIVMASTHRSTLQLGIQRLIGTAIGAIGGALFTITLGTTPWSLTASVFATIFLASAWKFNEAAKLSGYVSAIVLLTHNESPWLYAWGRFLETLLGIAVALLVNNLIFPVSASTELRRCLAQTLLGLEQFYSAVVQCAFTGNYDRPDAEALKANIMRSLQKGRELWKETRTGQPDANDNAVNQVWEFLIRRIWEHILTMEHTVLVRQQGSFWQTLAAPLTELSQASSNAMLALATAVKMGDSEVALPGLQAALTQATEQLHQLQELQQGCYPMDELLRFFTFFYTMEEVGRKLERMAGNLSRD